MIWSTFVVSWFYFGFSLVFYKEQIYKEKRKEILTKSTFANTHSFGGRTYPVRNYPIIQKQSPSL